MAVTIYHNPRCSKSRATLALLEENGVQPDIIEYLQTPPSAEELGRMLEALGMEPRALMREKEEPYKALNLADESLGSEALIDAMIEKGIRDDYIVLVGGAPLNEAFADSIGADAYCRDAAVAVETAKERIAAKREAQAAAMAQGADMFHVFPPQPPPPHQETPPSLQHSPTH